MNRRIKVKLVSVFIALLCFGIVGQSHVNTVKAELNDAQQQTLTRVLKNHMTTVTDSQKQFVSNIYDSAIQSHQQTGVLPSVIVAQAILESGWGTSDLGAAPNYNLFGVKADASWNGQVYRKTTRDFVNGQQTIIEAKFRKYDSWTQSVIDHGNFFTSTNFRKNHYGAFLSATNYKEALTELGKTGYATDKSYAPKLIEIVERYRLDLLDNPKTNRDVSDSNETGNETETKEVITNNTSNLTGYTGLLQHVNGTWYYVVQDTLALNYTGLVEYNGTLYYVQNGKLDWGVETLVTKDGVTYAIRNSSVDFGYTGLAQNQDTKQWYYVNKGKVDSTYSGLVYYNGTWYNVIKGYLDWGYSGLVLYNDTWYYVQNGEINWGVETLATRNNVTYYVKNAQINTTYVGLAQNHDTKQWYYINKGKVDTTYSGLVYYNGTWYNVINGYLNWSFTGLVHYNSNQYYIQIGQLNWGINGVVTVNNRHYYIENSTFARQYTGLAQHNNGTWYYFENGMHNKNFTGLVLYNGTQYYVKNGQIDWSFEGTIQWNNNLYVIDNAKVVKTLSRTIYLDPGHGGYDGGATNGELYEKNATLSIGQILKDKLRQMGYSVLMTRKQDEFVVLRDRSKMANESIADIFVSLHINSSASSSSKGLETYWYNGQGNSALNNPLKNDEKRLNDSKLLAELVQQNIVASTGLYNRGVKRENFSVLRETKLRKGI